MFDIILAIDQNGGIGKDGAIPWRCSEDLKLFKAKTMDSILIIGRKTYDTLPKLKGREIYVVTRDLCPDVMDRYFNALQTAITTAEQTGKKVFIAGGAQIYKQVFDDRNLRPMIDTIHISVMKGEYDCDTHVRYPCPPPNFGAFLIKTKVDYEDFTHYELKPVSHNHGELQYLEILNTTLGAVVRQGRNGNTLSSFVEHLTFDLRDGFPLLTTKKMFFRGIVEELLFFLRGDTDSKMLEAKNVNIWKGNTTREFLDSIGKTERKEGMMGPMYGYQWRNFGAPYDEKTGRTTGATHIDRGVDQLADVVNLIKTDPHSRRILMTDYNPTQAKEGVLYPCHSIILQFYVQGDFLDMFCYNRSQDFFLGNPFNIASSALLLSIVAKLTGKTPRHFHLTMGDVHIYESHIDIAHKQLERTPFVLPKLNIHNDLQSLDEIEKWVYEDFDLVGYKSHPALKAQMVA